MAWLVTGGAGYVGAHVVRAMLDAGADVVVLDDLSTGERGRVDPRAVLVEAGVADAAEVLAAHPVDGVVHVAAKKSVPESLADPLLYYRENVGGLVALLAACRDAAVERFVFSSSAAVYGLPDVDLVDEDAPCAPLSPYGATKLVGEQLLRDCTAAWGLRPVQLRYFNVAGAAAPALSDSGVTNLVPLVFERLDAGERPRVFGADWPTPDGTCVRDYVHVADVAAAHVAAARALDAGAGPLTCNVGRGEGASVLEVLRVVGKVTGLDTTPEVVPRRPGDPARVVAAVDRARAQLGVQARHDLRDMVASAWAGWRARHDAPGR